MREDWRLPDGAAESGFRPRGVKKEPKMVRGGGVTYFAHFAAYDGGGLTDLTPNEFCGAVPGVRVADFPRFLFALRNLLAEEPDDDAVNSSLRDVLSGLDLVSEEAKGDERAFLAALTANPNDYAGWCAYSDWRMERDLPPLLAEILRLHMPYNGSIQPRNGRTKEGALVHNHVAQMSNHIDRRFDTDRFHHFILFDDLWANAYPDLAASILRVASRWDPL